MSKFTVPTDDGLNLALVGGAAGGGLAALVGIVVLILCILIVVIRKRKRTNYDITGKGRTLCMYSVWSVIPHHSDILVCMLNIMISKQ